MGPAADIYDPSTILNPDTGLANMLASFSDAKSEASETINGVDTVKVTGKVSADAVNKLHPAVARPPGRCRARPGSRRTATTTWCRPSIEQSSGNSIQMTLSDWNKPVTVTKPQV